MKEDIKRIKQNTSKFNKIDEQKEIKKAYFKGCDFCEGYSCPYIIKYDLKFHISNNILQLLENNSTILEIKIQFCPNCGKQLVKELDEYLN